MQDPKHNLSGTSRRAPSTIQIILLSCWAVAVAGLGGFAAGFALTKLGTFGAVSLWLVGEAAGFVGRRLVAEKSKLAGGILATACVGALVVAEVCWLHWATVQGAESWLAAIRLLPTFVQEKFVAAVVGAVFCFIGANSAFRQVALRYRTVRIIED